MTKKKDQKNEKRKKLTPYDVVTNLASLFILGTLFTLVMNIVYMVSEEVYLSSIVLAISSFLFFLSAITGLSVGKEHEKLKECFLFLLISGVVYVISLVIMGIEDADFEEMLSGIISSAFTFLFWGVILARAYVYMRKGSKGEAENEA